MTKRIDITGQRYGRLVAVEYVGQSKWRCKCDCGNESLTAQYTLKRGESTSCGCFKKEAVSRDKTKHGFTADRRVKPEYRAWINMKSRCYNKKIDRYKDYGGRGITICDRWRNSFENFYTDIGPKPGPGYSIDRIDNDGNYEPGNLRWSDALTQSNNRRNVKRAA